ncbi:fatty acyl-CoA reductase wat-like [Periplaneta americana]|uniref:fatty acyl-CoA reductase wat-like n=1 Tax=Periplaneta americana TaxID=6978 RepID=UPI0037E7363E
MTSIIENAAMRGMHDVRTEDPRQSSIVNLKDEQLIEHKSSVLQEFYRDTHILVTGGTGFMGKVLIQKLLRSCPHICTIYLLVRGKKGKSVQTRMQELFNDPLFERLNLEQPDFRSKVKAIQGDCSQPGLGLSSDDRQLLQRNVNIVFHGAATVRFDEKLKIAVNINVQGTRDLLLLCKDCLNIKVVMHVSTAYANCNRHDIGEELYDPPMPGDKAIQLVDCLSDEALTQFTPKLLGNWPNTYAFTKAIAEDTVKTYSKGLTVGIFRPSIIVCTKNDPVSGWIDNLYGPTGAVVGVGVGMIRTMHINGKYMADIVPCDMAINGLISSAWDTYERRRCGEEDIPVYNFVSSCENPISWGDYINLNIKHSWQAPFDNAIWMVTFTQTNVLFLYKIYALFLHLLPALLVDVVFFSVGHKPSMIKTYRKLHKFTDVISYFCTRQWKFSNKNVQQMWDKIGEDDRAIFDFNIRNLDWSSYFREALMGVRTFLLKEDPKNLPQAIKKRYRLYWLHQIFKLSLLCLFLWLCWFIVITILRWTAFTISTCQTIVDKVG